jgi:hypothetical protein
MRWWTLLIATMLATGCTPEETPALDENALPRVTAELNDGDPIDNGATVVATISDADGEQCSLEVEYSFDEGLTYAPATIPQHTAGNLAEVSCPDVGEKITLVWDLEGDRGADPSLIAILRFLPHDLEDAGPPAHLLIDLADKENLKVGGGYVQREGAQGTQWQYHATAMAHVLVTSEGAATTGEGLFGADSFSSTDLQWGYELPTPPPEAHFQAMDWGGAQPGVGAFYLPVVFKDMDQSGTWDDTEEIVGVADRAMVAYIRPDGDWAHDDWYVIGFDAFADPQLYLEFLPSDTPIDLSLKGYSVFSGSMELAVANASDVSSSRRLGIMPALQDPLVGPDVQEMTSVPFDPMAATVTLDVHTDQLPPEHWEELEWDGIADEAYVEALFLYLDGDGDGAIGEGELLTHRVGRTDDSAYLFFVHLEGSITWDDLWTWATDDCWNGFNLIAPFEHGDEIFERWICYPIEDPPEVSVYPF